MICVFILGILLHLQFLLRAVGTQLSMPVVVLQNISTPGDDFEKLIRVDTIELNIAVTVIQQLSQTPHLKFENRFKFNEKKKPLKVL